MDDWGISKNIIQYVEPLLLLVMFHKSLGWQQTQEQLQASWFKIIVIMSLFTFKLSRSDFESIDREAWNPMRISLCQKQQTAS